MASRSNTTLTGTDLFDLLEFHNPERGRVSCVGWAKTKNRRCWRPVAKEKEDAVDRILDALPDEVHYPPILQARLRALADLTLCHDHGHRRRESQGPGIVAGWYERILEEIDDEEKEAPPSPASSSSSINIELSRQSTHSTLSSHTMERTSTATSRTSSRASTSLSSQSRDQNDLLQHVQQHVDLLHDQIQHTQQLMLLILMQYTRTAGSEVQTPTSGSSQALALSSRTLSLSRTRSWITSVSESTLSGIIPATEDRSADAQSRARTGRLRSVTASS